MKRNPFILLNTAFSAASLMHLGVTNILVKRSITYRCNEACYIYHKNLRI